VAAAAPPPAQAPATVAARPSASAGARRIAASPLARRLAQRDGIDLRALRGTGPRGRIIRRDVEAARAGDPAGAGLRPAAKAAGPYPVPSPRPPARVPLAGMRRAIATALQRSKVAAPHFYATIEIDLTDTLAERKRREAEGLQASVNDVILRAVAQALADEPRVNCRVSDEAIDYPEDVNIGIAVGLDEGLVVPVLLRAQGRSLADIAAESRRIIDLARGGKLVGSGQGTFTISNLGMYGVRCFTAVINPPEGAILAVGKAIERAVPAGGGFLPRSILEVTLSSDHRAIDGVLAAKFLARLKAILEQPARIF
jgi:pyruvate dehydrogenase E2 component (dihydrolipoamide acetyltransferase)